MLAHRLWPAAASAAKGTVLSKNNWGLMEMVEDKTLESSLSRRSARSLLPFAVVAAACAGLAGCSESISSVSVPRFSELMRSYDDTLTAEERKDAIAELQKEQAQAEAAKN